METRQHSPAVARNREPIANVLDAVLPASGEVLEISAGSGEHAWFFAARYPGLRWQPTDVDPVALASIAAWRETEGSPNLASPRPLDVCTAGDWPEAPVDAIFCANMIHISPWANTLGLLDGAARTLKEGGVLVLYGPFKVDGKHTAPSNEQFDRWLHSQSTGWGVRDRGTVEAEAEARGLFLSNAVAMPANNLTVVFRRR